MGNKLTKFQAYADGLASLRLIFNSLVPWDSNHVIHITVLQFLLEKGGSPLAVLLVKGVREVEKGLSRTQEEHVEHLRLVLEILKKEKLYAKFLRVILAKRSTVFGHVINGMGFSCPSKIELFRIGKPLELRLRSVRLLIGVMTRLCVDAESQKELNMQQRHWIELFSDCDCKIRYHPSKANVVADALSRKERVKPKRVRAMNMTLQSSIKGMILAAQKEAVDKSTGLQMDGMIEQRSDGTLYYLDRIWVPLNGDVRTLIMDESHKSKYCVHLKADKMYYDLRDRLKAEHQRHIISMQQHLRFPNGKWEESYDFVNKFPRTSSGRSTPIWDTCRTSLTKSAHFLPMHEDYKMDRLARLYLNEIVARLFSVGDYVLLKVSPWKCVVRFGKKGKLAPRFIGPFEIGKKVGPVAYRLDLPEELNGVHANVPRST
ncbi:hypothetical protein Tco_1227506 [Tanacetum coccineum]